MSDSRRQDQATFAVDGIRLKSANQTVDMVDDNKARDFTIKGHN